MQVAHRRVDVRALARACVRACARVRVRVRVCVCVRVRSRSWMCESMQGNFNFRRKKTTFEHVEVLACAERHR